MVKKKHDEISLSEEAAARFAEERRIKEEQQNKEKANIPEFKLAQRPHPKGVKTRKEKVGAAIQFGGALGMLAASLAIAVAVVGTIMTGGAALPAFAAVGALVLPAVIPSLVANLTGIAIGASGRNDREKANLAVDTNNVKECKERCPKLYEVAQGVVEKHGFKNEKDKIKKIAEQLSKLGDKNLMEYENFVKGFKPHVAKYSDLSELVKDKDKSHAQSKAQDNNPKVDSPRGVTVSKARSEGRSL